MTLPSIGWLPYGSNHPSVICQTSLKTAASVTGLSATVAVLGSGTQVHDAVRGMMVGASGGYKITNLARHDECNTSGWQISVEIERDWVCYGGNGSTGYDPAATQDFGLVYGNGGPQIITKSTDMRINGSIATSTLNGEWKDHGAVNTALNWHPEYHSAGKGDFVTVNVGFMGGQNGGKWFMAVDGLILKAANAAYVAAVADFFNVFDIGKTANGITSHYCRNFQLAACPPTFPVVPMLSCVAFIGDSFNATATGSDDNTTVDKYRGFNLGAAVAGNYLYDTHFVYEAKRELARNGLWMGQDYIRPNYGSQTSGVIDSASIPAIVLKRPVGVVYSGGTNDAVAARTASQVSTTLQAQFSTLFAAGVKWIVMPNIPTLRNDIDYATTVFDANVDTVNAGIATAIATYTAANPTHIIKSCDVFTAFGGHAANNPHMYTNDVHPSALGSVVRGRLIGQAILQCLSAL